MLLVSSTAPASSASHSQMFSQNGIKALPPLGKSIGIRGIMENRTFVGVTDRVHSQEFSVKTHATGLLFSHIIEKPEVSDCMNFSNNVPYGDELDDIEILFSKKWSESMGSYPIGDGDLDYVKRAHVMSHEDKLLAVSEQIGYSPNLSSETRTILPVDPTVDAVPNTTTLDASINNVISVVNSSIDASVGKGEVAVKNTLDAITSSLANTTQSVTTAIDNALNSVLSNVDSSAEIASNRLTSISADLKDSMSKVGVTSIEVLRQVVITLEAYLATGFSLILYYYGSAKEFLPPEVKDALGGIESRIIEIFGPVATVFKQIYTAIEVLETNLGLDPSDPILPLFLFLGTSATLWIFYRALVYGGYAGDLSPQLTMDLVTGEKNAVLIDIRPEDLREKDGVPDLRRGARFKYANIALPEIDGSVRKLVKKERDLYDTLTAAVIQNMKIVQDRSKVIVLDADGSRSKSIARSLRKLGVKKPYLVEGGFQSWVKNGLRVKELRPETALTLLNEEAEAILEDFRPSPLQIAGYGVGFVAASYALLEWEKTLQYIALIGLGQTIYRRIASYEDSEDFKQDVSLLLGPFKVGATAFSWAATKLEPNKVGLPTSPSSTDVQSRVQQAAAKHESQPSDSEESQESLPVAASDNDDSLAS